MDDLPEFSQIQDIFIVQSVCFLRVNAFFTKGIDRHFHSYAIEKKDQESIIGLQDLFGYQTGKSPGKYYIFCT